VSDRELLKRVDDLLIKKAKWHGNPNFGDKKAYVTFLIKDYADITMDIYQRLKQPEPEQREWQGLTDEEIGSVIEASQITLKNYCSEDKQTEYARAIEAKLKEKNHG
jgi:hypothetical protein